MCVYSVQLLILISCYLIDLAARESAVSLLSTLAALGENVECAVQCKRRGEERRETRADEVARERAYRFQ